MHRQIVCNAEVQMEGEPYSIYVKLYIFADERH